MWWELPPTDPHPRARLVLAHVARALKQLALVLLEPQRLGHHPLGADGALAVAVHAQRLVAARRHLGRLRRAAHVHPQQRRAQRLACLVQRHHGAARGVDCRGACGWGCVGKRVRVREGVHGDDAARRTSTHPPPHPRAPHTAAMSSGDTPAAATAPRVALPSASHQSAGFCSAQEGWGKEVA